MSTDVAVAVVGAGGALLGAAVGALGSYHAAKIGFNANGLRRSLRIALKDILAYHEIEARYAAEFENRLGESATAAKLRIRQEVRNSCGIELSRNSEPKRVRQRIQSLDGE